VEEKDNVILNVFIYCLVLIIGLIIFILSSPPSIDDITNKIYFSTLILLLYNECYYDYKHSGHCCRSNVTDVTFNNLCSVTNNFQLF